MNRSLLQHKSILWRLCYLGLILSCQLLLVAKVAESAEKTEDLYKLLGVSRTATTKEIKQAYRRKALDTHPDKNKSVSKEAAAEAFQKVVHAFEVLSDSTSRKNYDRTGRTNGSTSTNGNSGSGNYGGSQNYGFQWSYTRTTYQQPKLKDRFDVKEAMSRVIHIVSLEQLKTIILDDKNEFLERNLLICFTTRNLERHVNDEMVFPFPFAAKSSQGIWWEDILQTAMVRFHRENDLTRFFGIPHGETMDAPIFLFGKRGQPLSHEWPRKSTKNRHDFEMWTWSQLEVQVEFINQHHFPAEVYWIHGSSANSPFIIEPGASSFHTTMLSHEWWVRDARTDRRPDSPGRNRLTKNSTLAEWKILSDEQHQKLIIEPKACFDLSGHCLYWVQSGECVKNPIFMAEVCWKSCGLCSEEDDMLFRENLAEDEENDEFDEETDELNDEEEPNDEL
jgi:curved DNA-binding protein CbpA